MPELPDLEIFKGNIFARLTSKKLAGLTVFNFKKVNVPESILSEELAGRELLSIGRVGKELIFDFGDGKTLAVHLMLNGEIAITDDEAAVEKIKFKIFALRFEAQSLVFSDRGGLCTVKFKPVIGKAPDAFDAAFTLDYFLRLARKKPMVNVKAFLIDQSVVKGIGNAYADEILWAARVSPRSLLGRIPDEALTDLYNTIGVVLRDAIGSIRRISPERISGEERSFLAVHNRALKQTATGHAITVEQIASKVTYYTDEQVLY